MRFLCFDKIRKSCIHAQKTLPSDCFCRWLPAGLPAGSFVPTNTKQALSNMLQRRSGAMMQPPSLHAITSQQQLIQIEASAAAAATAASQASPDAAFPAGLSRSAVSSTFHWFLLARNGCGPVTDSSCAGILVPV